MTELEKLQNLHHRAVAGESLSNDEMADLQNWYDLSDRQEDALLNGFTQVQSLEELRQNLAMVNRQAANISSEIRSLTTENSLLQEQNHTLRTALERRLLEKVA
jgi:predicted  nucleic acid-binding Zn-ribbon protein